MATNIRAYERKAWAKKMTVAPAVASQPGLASSKTLPLPSPSHARARPTVTKQATTNFHSESKTIPWKRYTRQGSFPFQPHVNPLMYIETGVNLGLQTLLVSGSGGLSHRS